MLNLKWGSNKMKFIKLNNGGDAEPNASMPSIELLEAIPVIRVSFYQP